LKYIRGYRHVMTSQTKNQRRPPEFVIPDELADFIRGESYSLLIKGGPGTGKTTLALTILRALRINSNFLYISTRSSPSQFFKNHPWMEGTFDGREGKAKPGEKLSSGFVDGRLDEPSPLFERITSQLMDVRSPMIAVDSWNSLQDSLGKDELQMNMRVLQTWRDRVNAKLLFVGEDLHESAIDSLMDGIVTLKQMEVDNRRVRELLISKLQGTRVANPHYHFTLNNGTFTSFSHYNASWTSIRVSPSASQAPAKKVEGMKISSGFPELDKQLGGGFSGRSIVHLQIGSGADSRIALILIRPLVSDFVSRGKRVRFVPLDGLDKEFVDSYFKSSVPATKLGLVTQLSPFKDLRVKAGSGPLGRSGSSLVEEKEDSLTILGSQGSHEVKGGFDYLSLLIREGHGLTVVLTREYEKEVSDRVDALARTRMRIVDMNGTILLRPDVPFAPFHAIEMAAPEMGQGIRLEPMV
jgi:KaiC/GvpD/RAD55 family RecA-like ATPase